MRDPSLVSLRLVTGPANAEKARVVLDGVRAARERDPILVVPTGSDVARYRRELAAAGAVFGVRVLTFSGLLDEVAARTGIAGTLLGAVGRERVAAAVAARTPLRALAGSARTPGFPRALAALCAELEAARVEPPRLTQALRDWASATGRDGAYGEELAALYRSWRAALERLGRTTRERRDAAALDALALQPERWGETPVAVYGFDDLTPVQTDALMVLGRGAEVTVSLPYEAGRAAFAGRATTFEALAPEAAEVVALEARAQHYAPEGRDALHHLERHLFEPQAPRAPAGDAVALLEGGGERAELELVAAEVRALLDRGVAAEEIAVVTRAPERAAALVEQVFEGLDVPIAVPRTVALGHTALGRGLLGLLRAALLDGTAGDVLDWLRTPGRLDRAEAADALERRVRRDGVRDAETARAAWEEEGARASLWELDALRAAAAESPLALLHEAAQRLSDLFAGPWRGSAAVLTGAELVDARVHVAARRALGELQALARADARLAPSAAELVAALEAVEVDAAPPAAPGAVAVTTPLAVRARRVRALIAFGLQEGTFPPPARPEPFLGDEARRELAVHTGLRLPLRADDALGAERYLFYAMASRPEERLVLSWRTGTDDGDPAVRSFFVDDVLDLFDGDLPAGTRRRALGAVGWPGEAAPTLREAARTAALAGPRLRPAPLGPLRDERILAAVRERRAWSGTAVETLAGCGVRWFVERWLRPGTIEPDPEPMARGSLAHRLLEEVLRAVAGRPLRPDDLPALRARLREALAEHAGRHPISANAQRLRAGVRRLEADLDRMLAHAVTSGSTYAPSRFEVGFGGEDDELGPLDLGDGVRVYGRIDRIDVSPDGRRALVYDYKGTFPTPGEKWVGERALQVGLYLLAAEQLLGLEPAGGFYQAYRDREVRGRGAIVAGADPALPVVNGDELEPAAFRALLDDVVAVARRAVDAARAGQLTARPDTCGFAGRGCAYPSICRVDAP